MGKLPKNLELVYGIHPIIELLRAKKRKLYTLYISKPIPKSWPMIEQRIGSYVAIHTVSKEKLTTLAGTSDHQGVVGFAGPSIIRNTFFNTQKSPLLLMLCEIQDPRNVGAILRSAYCTNIDGIVLTRKNSAPINAVALKSSAGLAEHLAVYYAPTVAAAMTEVKKAGYKIYCAALGGQNAVQVDYQLPLCIVIGNEATGIPAYALKQGTTITLPQKEAAISYNASVAAGILCFTIAQKIGRLT